MTATTFIYTDQPLSRTEYSLEDIFGEEYMAFVFTEGLPLFGIHFSQEKLHEIDEEAAGNPFPELIRYRVVSFAGFEYNKHYPENIKRSSRRSLDWLLEIARRHLRNGAKKFYYASLCTPTYWDKKKPKMKEIDLAKFRPKEKKFEFGSFTIWEFVDSSIKK
jgi:hypothetical protein